MLRDLYTAYSDNDSTYSFTDGESVDDVDALADEVDLKFCTGCQDFKIKNDFHKDKTTKYGVKSQCKECKKKASATYIEKIAKKNVEVDIIDSVDEDEDQRSCCIFPSFVWNN
jgi:hypothetical protein